MYLYSIVLTESLISGLSTICRLIPVCCDVFVYFYYFLSQGYFIVSCGLSLSVIRYFCARVFLPLEFSSSILFQRAEGMLLSCKLYTTPRMDWNVVVHLAVFFSLVREATKQMHINFQLSWFEGNLTQLGRRFVIIDDFDYINLFVFFRLLSFLL